MTDQTEAPELLPCPFCKGGETRIEPCGLTWRGQGYSDPQFYRLTHHGKLPQGDGFETCHILFRARTIHDIVSMWNTRKDLSDALKTRIAELEAKLAKAVELLEWQTRLVDNNITPNNETTHRISIAGTWYTGPVVDWTHSVLTSWKKTNRATLAEMKETDQ